MISLFCKMSLIHIFLLCFIIKSSNALNSRMVDNSKYAVGYQIAHGVFKTLNTIGIVGCQKECIKITVCQSIGYNKETLECSLGQYADNKTFTGVITDVFIRPNGTNEILENIGLCKDRPCAFNERCVMLSSGSPTCIRSFQPFDLTFLLDGSKSLTSSAFYSFLDCIRYVIDRLFDIRLAVATFNKETTISIHLDQYFTKSAMKMGLNGSVVYPDIVGNNLGQALLDVRNDIYNQSRGDRVEATNVILVLLAPDDMVETNLKEDADYIKSEHIRIITVGIDSKEKGMAIMQQVASEPVEQNILSVNSTDSLYNFYDTLCDMIFKLP